MKPKLLLHTCCAPCLLSALFHLKDDYEITVFYFNPNIYPEKEYQKRKSYAEKYCSENSIRFIEGDFNPAEWLSFVSKADNFAELPEGGERCSSCFEFRLRKAANYAKENGFSIFCTTLTSGANKKASQINAIGEKIAAEMKIRFLSKDFKKGGGYEFSRKECMRLGIYRQNYCGCRYSFRKNQS
jgi:hypothetical protein